jgi:hypothetical protein
MAFKRTQLTSGELTKILDYSQYLKTEDDPSIRRFKSPEGYWFNVTHIDQTPEQKAISESIQRLSKELQKNSINKEECQEKLVDIPSTSTVVKEAEEQPQISP